MEDPILSPGSLPCNPSDLAMDLDFMDELLLDGCWLETTDGSEVLNPNPSTPNAYFDSSWLLPNSDSNNENSNDSGAHINNHEERQKPLLSGDLEKNETGGEKSVDPRFGHSRVDVKTSNHLMGYAHEGAEISRRWWIGPRASTGPSTSVMQRLIQALGYLRDFTRDKDVLIQLWIPVNRGGRRVLTTQDQPFSLDPDCPRLASYRDISVNYHFSAEDGREAKDFLGLPGRVFLGKVPEWTPDVTFFGSDEYPRIAHAQLCGVRGTFGLPVFEQGSRTCVGVIEVVMTTQQIKYLPELESVCKALEAVNLRGSMVSSSQNVKASSKSYQSALPEIKQLLRRACETHRLPLAQTWVPCIQQGKEGCRHSNENYTHCVSTVDDACFINDPDIQNFHEACSEHHLLKGQGVAGAAFLTNQPCFSSDITSLKKTEYPLSHHAMMFGLCGAVAIHLRCIHTSTADFVLEFFLPADCKDPEEQMKMLNSLSTIIQQVSSSLRVVTDKELEEEADLEVSEVTVPPSHGITSREELAKAQDSDLGKCSLRYSSLTGSASEVPKSCDVAKIFQGGKSGVMLDENSCMVGEQREDFTIKGREQCGKEFTSNGAIFSSVAAGKTGEKKRSKAEKAITLQVLRQYFSGTLKDAAKRIGVCPTTLKRICRQHGIERWPSRKIKKVGHSLHKLQHVIDSVEGASGAFQIESFYSDFPELASPKLSGSDPFPTSKPGEPSKPSSMNPEGGISSSQAAATKSRSSGSQSSCSSHSCSSGMLQNSASTLATSEDAIMIENSGDGMLKRVRSASSQEVGVLSRSQSQRSLEEQPVFESVVPLKKKNVQIAQNQETDAWRVKVAYGEEKIRFRMRSKWTFKDLAQEIGRRFSIEDMSRFHIKYLDDDNEWVLLTCDADLEECIDICQTSQGQTIRLCLQVSHHGTDRSYASGSRSHC